MLLKTDGNCTYCGKKLDPKEYGACLSVPTADGAWEVDHWIPKSSFKKAADAEAFENLWPACCGCNDEKGATTGEAYIAKRKADGLPTNAGTSVLKRYLERTKEP